jgi:hypothetical protein
MDETAGVLAHMLIAERYEMVARQSRVVEEV